MYSDHVTVDMSGSAYNGTFTFTTYDQSGNQTFQATGTVVAQRITVDD